MAFGATGRGRSISPKKRKGTYQQDAKAACGLEVASLVDTIKNKFNNREEFECPHNPSPVKEMVAWTLLEIRISVPVLFPLALTGRIRKTKRFHLSQHIVGRLSAPTDLEMNTGEI